MTYELIGGFFFGISLSLSLYLILSVNRTRSLDVNLNTKSASDRGMDDIREDMNEMSDMVYRLEERVINLELKSNKSKKS